jgi:hypothetical protein
MSTVLPLPSLSTAEAADIDFERRFGGIARLYGDAALAAFRQAHICVIGVGGVGSWAVEALARSDGELSSGSSNLAMQHLLLEHMPGVGPEALEALAALPRLRTLALVCCSSGVSQDGAQAVLGRLGAAELVIHVVQENRAPRGEAWPRDIWDWWMDWRPACAARCELRG